MAEIDEYYKRQKEQLEQEKLNAAIQLNNARQDAMKNTQNYLRGSGYGTQGYGATQMINTNNAYNNQLGANKNDYWKRLQELDQQQNEAIQQKYQESFDKFSNVAGSFEGDNFYTQGQLYGLFKQDNNGKWQIDTENDAYKNLSLANQNALKGLVQNHEDNLNSTNIGTKKFGTDGNVSYVDINGNFGTDTIDSKFKLETNALNSALAGGQEMKNGSAIVMTNTWGDKVFLQYKNGELYYIDQSTYDKSKNKFAVNKNVLSKVENSETNNKDNNNDKNKANNVNYDNKTDWADNDYLNRRFKSTSVGFGRTPNEGDTIKVETGREFVFHDNWWYEI